MNVRRNISAFIIILHLLPFCLYPSIGNVDAAATRLKTESAEPADVRGSFSVILFGRSHIDDLETTAFLDHEGDSYTFEPFAPDFDYVIKKGLSAQEALSIAGKFVSFHPSFWKSQLTKIITPGGDVAGFELRPLYYPFIYGSSDVLDISYWPGKEGSIKVLITLIPSIRSLKFHPGGDGGFGGSH